MVESAALGGVMGGAQFKVHNFSVEMLGGGKVVPASAWRTAFMSMVEAATAQAAQGAFAGSLDMRSVVSNILASGATETLLSQAGFNKGKYDSSPTAEQYRPGFNQAVGYTVDVLGAGFAQTALASAMSGQPMDPTAVMLNSLTQLAIKLGVEAVKATSAPLPQAAASTHSADDPANQTLSQQGAGLQRKHTVNAAGQATTKRTDENGNNISRESAVAPPSTHKDPTPKDKKRAEQRVVDKARENKFKEGNVGLSKSNAPAPVADTSIKGINDYSASELWSALLEGNAEWRAEVGENWDAFEEQFTADPTGTLVAIGAGVKEDTSAFFARLYDDPKGMYKDLVQHGKNTYASAEDFLSADGLEQMRMIGRNPDVVVSMVPGVGVVAGTTAKLTGKVIEKVGKVNLYRAVNPSELNQIIKTKQFYNPDGIESKYFSTSLEGAQQYAEMAQKVFGEGPHSFVKTKIPIRLVNDSMKVNVDRGISTIVVPSEKLPKLSKPNVLNAPPIDRSIPYVKP